MIIRQIKNRLDGHRKEILSKGAIAFILKILGAGLAFLLQVAIARYLGASGAGIYFLAFTIVTLVATVARVGMDNSVTRFVAAHASENDWSKIKGVVRHALRIGLAASLVLSLVLFISADWLSEAIFGKPELATPLKIMSLIITPLSLMTLYASSLQGLKRVRDVMLMQSVLIPLFSLLILYITAPLFGISGAVMAYGVAVTITLIFGFWLWHRANKAWKEVQPKFSSKVLLSSSYTLLGAVLLQQLSIALPLLVLGAWSASAEVGLFSAAQRTANLVGSVLIAANIIVAPKFAELYQQKDMEALGKVARHGAVLMTGMAMPALLLFIFAPEWVMGLFGAEFSVGWLLLVIMSLGQLVNVATGSVGFLLIMTGNEKHLLTASWVSLFVSGILCLSLIPFIGALGAAIAVATSVAVTNIIRVRFVWYALGVRAIPFMNFRRK